MPITKSAKKNLRKNKKRRILNLKRKKKIKELLKKFKLALLEKKLEEMKKILPLLYKAIDKAAKKNVIKENKAARMKSKIAKILLKLERETKKESSQGLSQA